MQNTVRFAVVGCGHIGKRHAAMIRSNAECELAAVCDIVDREGLNIDDHAVPFYNSIDELLGSGIPLDVVCIATPNGLHEEHALKILKAGFHVVIEKPMALSKEGCERIIYESMQKHKHVFCVMQNRYSPPAVWLKEIVQQKLFGDIYIVQVNCYWNRDERYYTGKTWHGTKELDGGTLFTQFSHFIDMLFWLFGDIKNISGKLFDFNHSGLTDFEDSGFISFDFLGHGSGCLNYSTAVWKENLESSMTIIGQNGTIKVGGQYMNEVQYCNIKGYSMPELAPVNPPNDYGTYKGSAANHHYIIENVVDVLKGRAPITTNAMEGMKVVEMIERIYAAGKKNKTV